jgi:mevalonate kinase
MHIVNTHGKVILIGEHAAVYGHKAIVFPLDQVGVKIEAIQSDVSYISSSFFTGKVTDLDERYVSIKTLISKLDQFFNTSLHLNITLNIPLSAGLGASASLASAIVLSYYHFMQKELDDLTHFNWIQISEMLAHGNASGIDAFAMTQKHPFIYQKGHDFQTLNLSLDAYLCVVDTKIAGHTKEAVSKIRDHLLEDPLNINPMIESLGALTFQMEAALTAKDHDHIGACMTKAHHILKSLDVSHEILDELVDVALTCKAKGAKLTGGGLGGCMIAYFDNQAYLQTWIDYVKSKNLPYYIQKV